MMTTHTKTQRKQGFSLVEVTLALGIFGSSVLVLMGLAGVTAGFSMTNREMTKACQLAEQIFADLALPQTSVKASDTHRVLHTNASTSPYGVAVAPDREHYEKDPLVWMFTEDLTALEASDGEDVSYTAGCPEPEARFLVGVSFADETRFQAGIAAAAPLPAGVFKRVLVTVEAPANVAQEYRRKYEFYRLMEFR